MREYRVETLEYELNVADLLRRRLRGAEGVGVKEEKPGRALVLLRDEEARESLCRALCRILLRDAAVFELASEVENAPLSIEEKRAALSEAVELSRGEETDQALFTRCTVRLMEFTRTGKKLNLEGFLRFRMSEAWELYRSCALRASAAAILRREYAQLIEALRLMLSPKSDSAGQPNGAAAFMEEGGELVIILRGIWDAGADDDPPD